MPTELERGAGCGQSLKSNAGLAHRPGTRAAVTRARTRARGQECGRGHAGKTVGASRKVRIVGLDKLRLGCGHMQD